MPSIPSQPLITVAIAAFNQTRFLADAILSALRQSWVPVEVIVVDDGSTDHPEAVIELFHNVTLIRQPNQGLSVARNVGMEAANGRYIVFLDADDRLLPEALKANYQRMAANPGCGFVYAAHRLIDESGKRFWSIPLRDVGDDPYGALLKGNCIAMNGAVMYHRERLQALGGFDPRLEACEDYDVYLRMARRYPVACGQEVVADYRQHGTNTSRSSLKMLRSALLVLKRQEEFASSQPAWRNLFRQGETAWKAYYSSAYVKMLAGVTNPGEALKLLSSEMPGLLGTAPLSVLRAGLTNLATAFSRRRSEERDESW